MAQGRVQINVDNSDVIINGFRLKNSASDSLFTAYANAEITDEDLNVLKEMLVAKKRLLKDHVALAAAELEIANFEFFAYAFACISGINPDERAGVFALESEIAPGESDVCWCDLPDHFDFRKSIVSFLTGHASLAVVPAPTRGEVFSGTTGGSINIKRATFDTLFAAYEAGQISLNEGPLATYYTSMDDLDQGKLHDVFMGLWELYSKKIEFGAANTKAFTKFKASLEGKALLAKIEARHHLNSVDLDINLGTSATAKAA